ncbi:hypothetical protein MESS2_810028 [Mesorhizobium metallidurans STM 2683]|uniref:Uncharacterized protein n=1 Tax=Mesorhizobium metallidurans STM 2683 TaxID=1297569 RepID=M5EVM6_9HYPH|nr:hypothetical protein MESS2_810028 [Mesorhizobium metallidurans STM 2683]
MPARQSISAVRATCVHLDARSTRLKALNPRIADAIGYVGMPAASMLDRLGVPTLYPRDLGERLDMPFDLRRISGLSPPWRGSSVG